MDEKYKKVIGCGCIILLLWGMIYESAMTSKASNVEEPQSVIEEKSQEEAVSLTEEVESQEVNEIETTVENAEEISGENEYIVQTSYDKSIFVENGIEFHYVAGDTWQGVMAIVKDPARVFVGMPRDNYTGAAGANATVIGKRYGAVYAVNGAFFEDTNFHGNGGTPLGFVFSEGRQTAGGSGTVRNILGLDKDNNFVCEAMTGAQAVERGIRDAVSCSPILVQNGKVGDLKVKSTTLMDARTAVGAREDGAILILTVDGRMAHSIGAKTIDLAQCMIEFGAVNAGNLDGGGSVSLYYTGTPLTGISTCYGARPVPNAFCVRPE